MDSNETDILLSSTPVETEVQDRGSIRGVSGELSAEQKAGLMANLGKSRIDIGRQLAERVGVSGVDASGLPEDV